MTALVTGAAGFIGSTLATRLLADGHEVIAVDALTDYYDPDIKRANLQRISHERLRVVQGDLNELDLEPLLADVEVVYHQAGQPGVRASWGREFTRYTRDGGLATHTLADARYAFPLREDGDDASIAPLLCAGLIGWRSLVWPGTPNVWESTASARPGTSSSRLPAGRADQPMRSPGPAVRRPSPFNSAPYGSGRRTRPPTLA